MGKILLLLCLFTINVIEAQNGNDTFNNGLQTNPVVGQQSPNGIRDFVYGKWGQNNNVNSIIKGSVFLFSKWKTKGVIVSSDKKEYKISDVNINIKENHIVAKFQDNSKDSLFIFDNKSIDKILINNKEFVKKELTFKKVTKEFFVEKIGSVGKVSLYKLHYVFFKAGEFDRLSQQKTGEDRYIKGERYFIKKEKEKLIPLKLKKSDILNLFAEKKKQLKDYIKKNKLKVKEEQDFIKLLHYYDTL